MSALDGVIGGAARVIAWLRHRSARGRGDERCSVSDAWSASRRSNGVCGEDIQFRQVALTLLREKPETAQRILERDPPASPLQAALRRQFIKMAEERREAGAGDTSPGA